MDSECQWELRAKIKHWESCGLKNEQDEAEEKQELLVPPWRIEGAVKYWKALSVPKGSLRWVCYFNSLRVVLKDNLFLIPPASWSKWFSFLSPLWDHRRLSEGMARDRSLAPQPDPLSIIPCCLLHWTVPTASHTPFKLISNQCQGNAWALGSVLWWGLAALSFNCGVSPALRIPHCPAPSKIICIVCVKCSLLSI